LVFLVCNTVSALLFIPLRMYQPFDYRYFYIASHVVMWSTTIWVVYALLIAILKHLPGILRFSIWFLNIVFATWILISFLMARLDYSPYGLNQGSAWLARTMAQAYWLERVFFLAELLVILSILAFVLRFPIRVPKNLAAFSAALAILLFCQIAFISLFTYVPQIRHDSFGSIPTYVMLGCLIYWITSVSKAGEESQVTLGRGWQSVPKEHLVRQLDALNAALLRAREQSS
jgi:hypothetical protein